MPIQTPPTICFLCYLLKPLHRVKKDEAPGDVTTGDQSWAGIRTAATLTLDPKQAEPQIVTSILFPTSRSFPHLSESD